MHLGYLPRYEVLSMEFNNVIFPCQSSAEAESRWDIHVKDGKACRILPSQHMPGEPPKLLLPALCHPHIHLDKAYILTCNNSFSNRHPDYSDLVPNTGSFDEALGNTSKAKQRYTDEDLYLRGRQLLATSYQQGVTCLRAFVELDHVTGSLPLTTAIRLKSEFAHLLEMQICAFAQDPLFSTAHGDENRLTITALLTEYASCIQALGTTPYVEESREASLRNIKWAITTAIHHRLHLDFHLDYNLATPLPPNQPMVFSVVQQLQAHDWLALADESKTIVLGHCTQLTVLCDSELEQLATIIIQSKLPIHFVGLPSSDLFMMGRPGLETNASQARPRGTLHVISMIRDLGLSACIGINNVGNAFTPLGSGDPLEMAAWCVAIYQAGTISEAMILYGCISWLARRAIGFGENPGCGNIVEGTSLQGMLMVQNKRHIKLPGTADGSELTIPARQRTNLKDIVWDPPPIETRSIVK